MNSTGQCFVELVVFEAQSPVTKKNKVTDLAREMVVFAWNLRLLPDFRTNLVRRSVQEHGYPPAIRVAEWRNNEHRRWHGNRREGLSRRVF